MDEFLAVSRSDRQLSKCDSVEVMIVGKQVVTPEASIFSSECRRESQEIPGVLKSTPPKPLTFISISPSVFKQLSAFLKKQVQVLLH